MYSLSLDRASMSNGYNKNIKEILIRQRGDVRRKWSVHRHINKRLTNFCCLLQWFPIDATITFVVTAVATNMKFCGRGSVVEHRLAKARVEGSNPFVRFFLFLPVWRNGRRARLKIARETVEVRVLSPASHEGPMKLCFIQFHGLFLPHQNV
ncbi:MAG: hypothetical protein K0R57_4392 [Paenibacillaceae bacterium]|nr:hypothetical protein [Paenibacillaceae bacterium]